MLHSTLGRVGPCLEAPGTAEPTLAPLGAFVRQEYAADCARFLADLKQRVAATEVATHRPPQTRRSGGLTLTNSLSLSPCSVVGRRRRFVRTGCAHPGP